ncbi:MAG: hypothetical protein Q9M08_05920 [Mariprofundus sp.]|nr:hypothetical protein [Mariprofundus sp.]
MKKTLIIVAAAAFMLGSTAVMAKPFCASCHAGHKNKVGPAFATVVEAY